MNNYVSTEKSLKRWLKNRVKVTMATVVGFLIAGTVSFAMSVNGSEVENGENGYTLTQENIVGKQNVNGKTAGAVVTGTTENDKLIISNALENKTENEESWLLSVQSENNVITTEIGKDAVLSGKNLSRTTLNLWGKTETTNNGIIEKAENGWAAITISGAKENAKATFTNNGTVKGDINIEDNITLNNTGVIEGKIYADKKDGDKAIILSGANAKVGAVELKGTGNTLEIKDGVNDTIDNVISVDKITVTGSTVTFADGEINRAITSEDKHLLDITDSNVTNKMDLTSKGESASTIGTSNLINNYGKTAGTYTLINDGTLISNNAGSGIYTNAQAEKAVMNVVNNGEINIEASGWATGLNGKFDKEKENAEISITNNGNIVVVNGAGMDITNTGAESNKGTLINSENGTITTSKFGVGIIADGVGVEGINKGTITVKDSGYALKAANGAVATNEGKIILVPEVKDEETEKADETVEEIKLAAVTLGGGTFINASTIEAAAGTALINVEKLEGSSFINEGRAVVKVADKGTMVVINKNEEGKKADAGFQIVNAGTIELGKEAKMVDGKVDFVNEAGSKLVLGEGAKLGNTEESSFINAGTAEFGKGATISSDADFENTGILRVSGVDFSKIDSELTGDELTKAQLQKILEAVGVSFGEESSLDENVLDKAIGIITAYDDKGNEVVKIVGGNELENGTEGNAEIIFGDGGQTYKIAGVTVTVTGGEASGKILNIISKDSKAERENEEKPAPGQVGKLTVKGETTLSDFIINIEDTELTKGSGIVLDKGQVGNQNILTLKDSKVNGDKVERTITLDSYTTLKLDNTTVLGNIGSDTGTKGGIETAGNTTINGTVKAGRLTTDGNTVFEKAVTVGSAESNGIATNGTTWFKDTVTTTNTSFMKTNGTTHFDKDVTLTGNLTTNGITIFNGKVATSDKESVILGETFINKELALGGALNVGDGLKDSKAITATDDNGKLILSKDAKLSGENKTVTVNKDGEIILNVGTGTDKDGVYNENAFANTGDKITVSGEGKVNIAVGNKLTGDEAFVDLGGVNIESEVAADTEIYDVEVDENTAIFTYKTDLFEEDGILNGMNSQASEVGDYLPEKKVERGEQLDRLYSSNIYSETVRASYDMFKLNEDTVLSKNTAAKAGELVAEGKALYSKTEYDRDGRFGDRKSENETTGLLANLVYGLDNNSSLGFVFSGAKQDIDTDGGSADGEAFYFGAYKDTTIGKAQVRTGAAYQLNKFDSDNEAGARTTDASYDSNAYGVYTQATFTNDLGNGLSLQPKLRAGFTHIEQEAVKDAYFAMDEAEITTFDLTAGADLVKTVQYEKALAEFKLGAAYTYTMGDTDKEFTGAFKGGVENFDVLGAEIAENVFSVNLGAEVSYENGFFYNGGFTYEFGSDDTEAYGVNVGVGYKF